jgi:hypothetical protein
MAVKRGRGGACEDKERAAELVVVLALLEMAYGYEATAAGDADCNRTDQIIRAQVQKQAPKRSNF